MTRHAPNFRQKFALCFVVQFVKFKSMSDPDGQAPKTVQSAKPNTIEDRPQPIFNRARPKPFESERFSPSRFVDSPVEKYLVERLQTVEARLQKKKTKKAAWKKAAKAPPPVAKPAPVRDASPPPAPAKRVLKPSEATATIYWKKGLKFTLESDHPANLNVLLGDENIHWTGQYKGVANVFQTTFTAKIADVVDKIEKRLLKHDFRKVSH
jgi:hypothetical protein